MDDVLKEQVTTVLRKTLLSSIRSDTDAAKKILSLDERGFSFFIDEVFKCETKAISIAFREKQTLTVPAFGTFKFKPEREEAFKIIQETLNRYGYNKISDVKDPILRATLNGILEPLLTENYIKNRGNKRFNKGTIDGFTPKK